MKKNKNKIFRNVAQHFIKTKKRKNLIKRTKWDEINARAQQLFEIANNRWDELSDLGYYTRAMDDAANELGHDKFGFFNRKKPTKLQLIQEMYAARTFLNKLSATPEGAEADRLRIDAAIYEGAFGGEWKAKYGVTYDKDRIKEEYLSMVYEIFRDIEKSEAVLLYNSKSYYDSSTLIEDIYAIVESKGYMLSRDEAERRARQDAILDVINDIHVIINQFKVAESPELIYDYKQDFEEADWLISGLFG